MQDGRNNGVIPKTVNALISLPSFQPRSRLSDFYDVCRDTEEHARATGGKHAPTFSSGSQPVDKGLAIMRR
jgi:hypothetical protein